MPFVRVKHQLERILSVYLVIIKSRNWNPLVLFKHEAVLVVCLVVLLCKNDFYVVFLEVILQFLWSRIIVWFPQVRNNMEFAIELLVNYAVHGLI